MQDRQKPAEEKILYLMRGLPGSGKSTLASSLTGENGIVLSTDDYFICDGVYQFEPTKLGDAHRWNQARSKDAMEKGVPVIAIDNTNTKLWEMQPYAAMGLSHGYRVEIRIPMTPWRFDPATCFERNAHGVALETLVAMLNRFENPEASVEDILLASRPF
eukprot:m.80625 g.80625  ORF g.80625 m.80625 type:complete len:160 (+) comp12772_c0_seq5:239-718(+)